MSYRPVLKAACQSKDPKLTECALIGVEKMIAHGFMTISPTSSSSSGNEEATQTATDSPTSLHALHEDIVCVVCNITTWCEDRVQLQVIKTLLTVKGSVFFCSFRQHCHNMMLCLAWIRFDFAGGDLSSL